MKDVNLSVGSIGKYSYKLQEHTMKEIIGVDEAYYDDTGYMDQVQLDRREKRYSLIKKVKIIIK